jgi:tRNA pseudouridine-54 N-methylase
MREFIYYSGRARTSGNWPGGDLMKAGRMDIVCNVMIQCLFLSNKLRQDIKLHLSFNGPPNSPMHLEFDSSKMEKEKISKKDIGGLIKRMLYKCSEGKKNEVFPGCFIEKKSFSGILKEFENDDKKILVLEGKGENLRDVDDLCDCVFIIGDHEGLPKKEVKRFSKIKVGPEIYFASQVFVILNNELDLRRKG